MRPEVTLLVLLFFLGGARTRSTQTDAQLERQSSGTAAGAVPTPWDDPAQLTRLRETVEKFVSVVSELRVELGITSTELRRSRRQTVKLESEVEDLKAQNLAQEAELAVLKTRQATRDTESEKLKQENEAIQAHVTTMRTEIMNLIKENTALKMDLTALKSRQSTGEREVENLKEKNSIQEAELTAVRDGLHATETEVESLKSRTTEPPKVAFSAALPPVGFIEAGKTELNLVFSEIITSDGEAYSGATGFFKAPVKGVYYFRFTAMDKLSNRAMGITMYRNEKVVMYLTDFDTSNFDTYLSSGVTLQLEVGDAVNMRLPAGSRVYADVNHHNIFTGFLLFPL